MILVTKFRVNDLTESLGAQVEFSARQNSAFWEFTEDECIVEIECRSLADATYKHVINALFRLSPSRGDYKNYLHQEINLKKIFLDELHLTAASNSNDYFAIKKKPNGKYVLYYIPAGQLFSGFYEIAASDQIIVCEDSSNSLAQTSGRYGVKQLITYGAPGTGKSKQTKDEVAGHVWFRTTFHPDSDYASFVGAYKPRMREDGVALTEVSQKDAAGQLVGTEIHDQRKGIAYDFVDQVFTKAYVEAWKLQKKTAEGATPEPVFLVIEEINRGNCAQIFGDIFQLLDRNGMGFSEYPVEPDSDLGRFIAAKISEDEAVMDAARKNAINGLYPEAKFDVVEKVLKGEQLLLPNNLFIRATMNTSDQSLFPIDSAFKRRWDWQYVPIAKPDKEGWVDRKIVVGTTKYDWWDFLTIINKHIAKATESEDKQLGYFFVKAPDDTGCITAERFANKVLFYLYGDVFKSYDLPAAAFKREGGAAWAFRDFFHSESAVVLKANGQFVKDADGNIVKTVSDEATQMLKKPGDVNEFELAAFLDHLKWKDATEEKSVGKANAGADA